MRNSEDQAPSRLSKHAGSNVKLSANNDHKEFDHDVDKVLQAWAIGRSCNADAAVAKTTSAYSDDTRSAAAPDSLNVMAAGIGARDCLGDFKDHYS
jgi:hypothetical protein